GSLYTMKDVDTLKKRLRQALKQELRFTIGHDTGSALDDRQVRLEFGDEDWAVPLQPGGYKVSVKGVNARPASVSVREGECLLLKLREIGPDRLGFERVICGDEYAQQGAHREEKANWVFSLVQNKVQPQQRRLDLMITLEHRGDRQNDGQ